MNKNQYLDELSFLLLDIADEERKDALSFYESYFDEAGIENELKVIAELGEPSKVAAIIKDSIKGHFEETIEAGDDGFDNKNYQKHHEIVKNEKKVGLFENLKIKFDELSKGDKGLILALIILAGLPVSGILFGTLEIALSLLIIPLTIVFGAWIITIALFIVGISLIVCGLIGFFSTPALGLILVGSGCVVLAFASIAEKLARWIFKDLIPKIIDVVSTFFNRLFSKGGVNV